MRNRLLVCIFLLLAACSSDRAENREATLPPPVLKDSTPKATSTQPIDNTPSAPLYQERRGNGEQVLVFLHGGPGYNSALFEATTADALAKNFSVVTYDRRGSGRSPAEINADAFTFASAVDDLDGILTNIPAPILLAHSFGGALALHYLEKHPDFQGKVVLLNAPISYPRSLATIIKNCRKVYEANNDKANLKYLDQLEAMDPASSSYASFAFQHGMSCGLYQPASPTVHAKELSQTASASPDAKYFSDSKPAPFLGFRSNEKYTTIDLSSLVTKHKNHLYAIYGDEDRIISEEDRAFLKTTLGERYQEIPGAAHNLFVDQQDAFVAALRTIANP